MTKKLLDLSHHNLKGNDRYDYAVVAENVDGIILKCSDPEIVSPERGHDHTHAEAFDGFKAAGLPVAEYHFYDPSESPQSNLIFYVKFTRKGFLDVLDVEDQEKYSFSQLTTGVIATLKEGANKTGRKWWLYGNYDFLDNRLLDNYGIADNIAGIWLGWPAPSAKDFPKPRKYAKAAVGIWQKSWWYSCPGIKDTTLDYNEFVWSDEKWAALIGLPPRPTLEERVAALEARCPLEE